MAPRRYRMSNRRSASDDTRSRIVEATLKLHGERGIFGTSWADIAREADVALGTVYRHFPSLDELVPACGQLLMEQTQPPGPEDIATIIDGATMPKARLLNVAMALFGFYARAGRFIESDLRERELPAVQEWEAYLQDLVRSFVTRALEGIETDPAKAERVVFLFDVPTFTATARRGLAPGVAAEMATEMALAWLHQTDTTEGTANPGGT